MARLDKQTAARTLAKLRRSAAMPPQNKRRPGFSRKAQYGLFAAFVITVTGALVGLLMVITARIDPHRPATIPEWRHPGDPRAAITLDNLMRMASGLHSDTAGNRTDAIYFGGTAVTESATGWPPRSTGPSTSRTGGSADERGARRAPDRKSVV